MAQYLRRGRRAAGTSGTRLTDEPGVEQQGICLAQGLYRISIPASWSLERDENVLSLGHPRCDLAVNVSAAQHSNPAHQADAREHLRRFIQRFARPESVVVESDMPTLASVSCVDEEGVAWYAVAKTGGGTVVIATINGELRGSDDKGGWLEARTITDSLEVGPLEASRSQTKGEDDT